MSNNSNINNENESSPCIGTCSLDDNDICSGCYRSITEIISWKDNTEKQKREILDRCLLRQ